MDLSLVIPTYNERENIEGLVSEILWEFKVNKIKGEIIVVDDNSPDGTGEILDKLKRQKKIKVIHRSGKMGLSSAVLDGWKIAKGKVLGVMDADLSHPPDKIKELLNSIQKEGVDFAIGSRYVRGGQVTGRSFGRNAMSKIATIIARLFTRVKDPMTGFFMIKRECIKDVELDPKGFKILLEIIVKGNHKVIKEVPITFVDRKEGRSKVSRGEVLDYLRNVISYIASHSTLPKEFVRFSAVGAIGVVINLFFLFLLTDILGVFYLISAVFSFLIAMTANFFLNKKLTFGEDIGYQVGLKYLQFFSISLVALMANLILLYVFTDLWEIFYMISQVLAIALSSVINFVGNKIWTFG